ncbi:MAG TPA: hypothetical protein VKZ89_12850, partial [Thermobifida alba]|nr:hypothetical protein [Thermobifida alba]
YPRGHRDLSGLAFDRFLSLDGQAWALAGAAGQLWYLIVGTWGLAGIGMAAAGVIAVRRGGPFALRVAAGTLLVTTLGIAYASSAALPDEHRVGNYAYGRYLACLAVVWLLAGLVVLVRGRRAAVLGCAAASAGLAAACLPRFRAAAVAAVTAAIHLAFAAHLAPAAPPGGDGLPAPVAGGTVAVDERVAWRIRVTLAHKVWWTALERYDGTRQGPPDVCTAIVPPEAGPPPPGWTVTGNGRFWTAWTAASCR